MITNKTDTMHLECIESGSHYHKDYSVFRRDNLDLHLRVTFRPKKTCPFPISYRPCSSTCYSKGFFKVCRDFRNNSIKTYVFLVILHLIIMFILFRMYF